MPRRRKKRYKLAVINKRKYYFYTIRWLDITGDAGHKSKEEMDKLHGALLLIKRLPVDVEINYSYTCEHGIDTKLKEE